MAEVENKETVARAKPSVASLAALNDDELRDVLGLNRTLEKAKEAITGMQGLTGKALEYANERVERMLTPNVYPYEFEHIVTDAQRAAKREQSGKDAACDCNPCCVLD